MKTTCLTTFLLAFLMVMCGCEDDKKEDSTSTSEEGGGGHTYSWQDPSTVSRSYTYDVVVINSRNQAIPGTLVTFEVEGYVSARQAMTSAEGLVSFSLNCPPNENFYILAQSIGYKSGSLSAATGGNTTQTFYITLADL